MNQVILPYMETKRLILRPINLKDQADIFAYAKDPQVGPSAGWEPHKTIKDSVDFINYCIKKREYGQPGVFAIIFKENFKLVGTIEIHSFREIKGEIGFVLHPDYWNKGIATEASKAVIVYGFELLNLKRLQYCHFPDNIKSKRVCEKLEFTYEGVLRNKYHLYDGTVLDDVVYSITNQDYENNKLSWLKSFKKDLFIDYTTKK